VTADLFCSVATDLLVLRVYALASRCVTPVDIPVPFLHCKFCCSSYMVFYIHIHRRLDVFACPVDVRVDFLVSGMVSWLMKYHVLSKLG